MGREEQKAGFCGTYHCVHMRDGEVIDEWDAKNVVVNQGLNAILNIVLGAQAAISSWYLGLFSGNYTPVAADTAGTIAVNATEVSAYSAGARQLFVPAASTVQSITNSASQASFTFTATVTIYGAFLISSSIINSSSNAPPYLMSAAQFSTPKSVVSGDQLLLTYTFNGTSTS